MVALWPHRNKPRPSIAADAGCRFRRPLGQPFHFMVPPMPVPVSEGTVGVDYLEIGFDVDRVPVISA